MTTFVDTTNCKRIKIDDLSGEMAEIVNHDLCGAEDVLATLRWLNDGQKFTTASLSSTHQLVYLMEGDGVINLDGKNYDVTTGAGVYLGPEETATVVQAGAAETKLLHLVAPIIEGR
jgi:glyoxylate utilization-related uncharacterized protein